MESEYRETFSAVERGDNTSKTRLAWYMLSGLGGAEVQMDEAVVLLEERIKDKDCEAMWMLGLCSEFGIGTEQDTERAKTLYEQSSNRGNTIGSFLKQNVNEEKQDGMLFKHS